MNLAVSDIRHNLSRFLLTTAGIGLLLMIVMGMAGIYEGLSEDALSYLRRAKADLWIVQKGTRGPFAEISRIPRNLENRALAVTGVACARAFVSHTIQREYKGKPLRMVVQGLAWPTDTGSSLPLVAGRALGQAHFEMVADRALGLRLGDRVPLGKDLYTVVGLTSGMVGAGGDGTAFFTIPDSIAVQYDTPGEAIRLEREARRARLGRLDLGNIQPAMLERAGGPVSFIPALGTQSVSAIMINVTPGSDPARVASVISGWSDVTVYTDAAEQELLLKGIQRNRRQLAMFRTLLIIISAIIMALILYTLTLDKVHDIAMLKLMGAQNHGHHWPDSATGPAARCFRLLSGICHRTLGVSALPTTGGDNRDEPHPTCGHCGGDLPFRESAGDMEGNIRSTQRYSVMRATVKSEALSVEVKALTKVYGRGNTEVVAMRNVAFEVHRGEVVALVGPSGAGKSTLLTAIGLINPPTSGTISISGCPVMNGPNPLVNLSAFRRKHLGFVFQKANLIPFPRQAGWTHARWRRRGNAATIDTHDQFLIGSAHALLTGCSPAGVGGRSPRRAVAPRLAGSAWGGRSPQGRSCRASLTVLLCLSQVKPICGRRAAA